MLIKVAGIDPSLSHTGLAKGTYDTTTGKLNITDLKLIDTEAQTGKTVRRNSDDMRRSTDIAVGIHDWLSDVSVAFAEIPTGSQSARANFAFGICIGVMSTVGIVGPFKGRLIQVSPRDIKKFAVGSPNASKEEMIQAATTAWPGAPWITRKLKGEIVLTNSNEHLADSAMAINAGLHTDEFKSVLQMVSGLVNETIPPKSE